MLFVTFYKFFLKSFFKAKEEVVGKLSYEGQAVNKKL